MMIRNPTLTYPIFDLDDLAWDLQTLIFGLSACCSMDIQVIWGQNRWLTRSRVLILNFLKPKEKNLMKKKDLRIDWSPTLMWTSETPSKPLTSVSMRSGGGCEILDRLDCQVDHSFFIKSGSDDLSRSKSSWSPWIISTTLHNHLHECLVMFGIEIKGKKGDYKRINVDLWWWSETLP